MRTQSEIESKLKIFQSHRRWGSGKIKSINCLFQATKKELQKKQVIDNKLLDKSSLNIKLVTEHEDDIKLARAIASNCKKGIKNLFGVMKFI